MANKLLLWIGFGGKTTNSVKDTQIAEQIVDKQVSKEKMAKLYAKMQNQK